MDLKISQNASYFMHVYIILTVFVSGCQYFITIWTRPYTGVSSHSDKYEASPGTVRDTNSGIVNGLISQSPKGYVKCLDE